LGRATPSLPRRVGPVLGKIGQGAGRQQYAKKRRVRRDRNQKDAYNAENRERKMGKEKFSENLKIKVTEKKSKSKKVKISPPSRRDPSKEEREDKRRQE
jgi:hypothetical protein